jgi:hypothetical protein
MTASYCRSDWKARISVYLPALFIVTLMWVNVSYGNGTEHRVLWICQHYWMIKSILQSVIKQLLSKRKPNETEMKSSLKDDNKCQTACKCQKFLTRKREGKGKKLKKDYTGFVHVFLFHTTLPGILTWEGMNDTQLSMIVENCVYSTSTDF